MAWRIATTLVVIAGLLTVAAFVCGLVSIWDGDDRWAATAGLFAVSGAGIATVAGFIAMVESDR